MAYHCRKFKESNVLNLYLKCISWPSPPPTPPTNKNHIWKLAAILAFVIFSEQHLDLVPCFLNQSSMTVCSIYQDPQNLSDNNNSFNLTNENKLSTNLNQELKAYDFTTSKMPNNTHKIVLDLPLSPWLHFQKKSSKTPKIDINLWSLKLFPYIMIPK